MPSAWTVTCVIEDEKGSQSQVRGYLKYQDRIVDIANEPGNPEYWARFFMRYLNDMTTGAVVSCSITLSVDLEPTIRSAPLVGSDVEEGAQLIWRTVGGFVARQRIPTFDEALILPGTREVDTSDGDVAAYLQFMSAQNIEMTEDWTVVVSDSRGDALASLRTAKEDFNRSTG